MTRHMHSKPTATAALALALIGVLAGPQAHGQEQARKADDLVDGVGVNLGGGLDTAHLSDLGLRHYRGIILSFDGPDPFVSFYNTTGISPMGHAIPKYAEHPGDGNYGRGLSNLVGTASALPQGGLALIDGFNEPNFGLDYSGWNNNTTWQQGSYDWQNDFYPYLKSNPATRNIPIANWTVGNLSNSMSPYANDAYDWENIHEYYGSQAPAAYTDRNIGWVNDGNGSGHPTKPIVVTEWGWSTTSGGDYPVTELAQAKNLPRGIGEFFNRGVRQEYIYDLIDGQQTYGLLHSDGSPKIAYTALKNFLATLSDSTWDSVNHVRNAPAFTPGVLDYSATGGTSLSAIHHTLLQKANGDFYLLLWNNVGSSTGGGQTTLASDVNNPAIPLTLLLKTPISGATVYAMNTDGTYAASSPALGTSGGYQTLSVSIPDSVTIVKLTPTGGLAATQTPPAYTTPAAAINAGGAATGGFGADSNVFTWTNAQRTVYDGETIPAITGGPATTTETIDTSGVTSPAPQGVYQSERDGITTYNVPALSPGRSYRVRLHFAETSAVTAAGQRKFDVALNGQTVLTDFDIFAAAGGADKAVVREFTAFANSDGKIIVQTLPHSAGQPKINGIEVLSDGTQYFVDDLNDLALVSDRSPDWAIDTFNQTNRHAGDPARATRTSDTTEYLTYHLNGIQTFWAQVQWYSGADLSKINFLVSPDGATWTPLAVTGNLNTLDWGWNQAYFTPPGGIPSGMNYLKVQFDQGADTNYDSYASASGPELAQINIAYRGTPMAVTEAPYHGPHAIPGTLEAEDYDTGGEGVAYHQTFAGGQTGYRSDNNGAVYVDSGAVNGDALGWTTGGQWDKYTVNASAAGQYTVAFRVASPTGQTGAFHLEDASGKNLTGAVDVPSTGGWLTYQTVTASVTLPAGTQTLRLVQDNAGWNLDNLVFTQVVQPTAISINAGGGAAGSFVADTDASGGSSYTSDDPVVVPDSGGAPASVYQSERYGTFTYTIPVNPPPANGGSYTAKLHFAEVWWGVSGKGGGSGTGQRLFNVSINGTNVLSNFDIVAAAGGADKAVVKTFTGLQPDASGNLVIAFAPAAGSPDQNAKVSGIEIVPQSPDPTNLTAR